jgi:methylmalonyl-CoA mutase N-terminal domain/subunit
VQILAEETNITRTVDPLAGSYYVEYLTNEIEKRVVEQINKVEESGGAIKALESGYISKTILSWFMEEQRAIQTGKKVIVRRNKYRLKDGENPWDYLKVHESDPEAVERQIKRLKEVRRKRDAQKWREALRDLRRAAEGSENMMPFIIEAARARASFGEITGVLKEVFGEYQDLNVI